MRKFPMILLALSCLFGAACTKTEKAELGGVEFSYAKLPERWWDGGGGNGESKTYAYNTAGDYNHILIKPYFLPLGNDSESLRQAPSFKGRTMVPTTVDGRSGLRASFKLGQQSVTEVLWNKDGRTLEARLTCSGPGQSGEQAQKDFLAWLPSLHARPTGKPVTNQDVQKLNLKWDSSAYARSSDSP